MEKQNVVKIKRALLSVSDKSQIVALAKKLVEFDVEIISTGGTAKTLIDGGVNVIPIEEITGNPESFEGRMKSLSFQVSSGLLFRRDSERDIKDAKKLGIKQIDLVVCNLYPFDKQYNQCSTKDELVELIDVGGPTMIRSGAKNFDSVLTVTSISQYDELFKQLEINSGGSDQVLRNRFAADAFKLLSGYDRLINVALMKNLETGDVLRYGENSHQKAWVLPEKENRLAGIVPIQGKELSYNNYLDSDSAINVIADLKTEYITLKSVVIIKHSNPCGMAVADTLVDSLNLAWAGDPISSFGSIIAFSDEVGLDVASIISEKFVEVVIAPSFSSEALKLFGEKKNLRVIKYNFENRKLSDYSWRSIDGGMLVQECDQSIFSKYNCVTDSEFSNEQNELVPFSQIAVKHLKSNAICIVRKVGSGFQLVGAGMGNPNRLISSNQAVEKAIENGVTELGATLVASDAFFPFADNVELLAKAGIKYIIQPGGSIKDSDVINCCNRLGVSMSLTNVRHFLH